MNPIVHAEVGWLVGHALPTRKERAMVTFAAVAPDLDGLTILGGTELYAAWHHRICHGLPAAITMPLVVYAITRSPRAALLSVVAFHTHIATDLAGSGPGWPIWYLWPFSDVAWLPTWQWDLASWQNSLFGLAMTLLCLGAALWARRTPVELLSVRADATVVATLRARFRSLAHD